jgi:hypothetical protein
MGIKKYFLLVPALALLYCSKTPNLTGTMDETGTGRPSAVMMGLVIYENANPVNDASVFLHDQSAIQKVVIQLKKRSAVHPSRQTRTNINGIFRFDSVDTGRYYVEINDHDSLGALVPKDVKPHDTLITVNAVLKRLGVVGGSVDTTGMPRNKPLSVYIVEIDRRIPVDSTGKLTVTALPPGEYTVRIVVGDSAIPSRLDSAQMKVNSGDTVKVDTIISGPKDTIPPVLKINTFPDSTSIDSILISGTASDAGGIKIVMVDSLATNGKALWTIKKYLNLGANKMTVIAVDSSNNRTTDTIVVYYEPLGYHDASLSSLSISQGSLMPLFNPESLSYRINVLNSVDSISLFQLARGTNATVSQNPANPVLLAFGENTITITVTARDKTTRKIYQVKVVRKKSSDATLAVLTPSVGTLAPAFSPMISLYSVSVPNDVDTISFSMLPAQPYAVVSQNPTNPISLAVGQNSIAITITAPDSITKKVYGITVTREKAVEWIPLANPTWFDYFVLDPVDTNKMYAAYSDGIYKSLDGGANWTQIYLYTADIITDMEIDPLHPDTMYIGVSAMGTGGVGVYRSFNRGNGWSQVYNSADVSCIAIDPVATNVVYAGTQTGSYSGATKGILKSGDHGSTWTQKNLGLSSLEIIDFAVNPTTPPTLYAATNSGFFKSDDGADTWYSSNMGLPGGVIITKIAIDRQNPSTLYLGTRGDGLFKTIDNGAHWSAAFSGITDATINFILVNPVYSEKIYASTASGVFKSVNSGTSWSMIDATNVFWGGDVGTLDISPARPNVLYAIFSQGSTGARIYKRME